MKITKILEARRNPAQNTKIGGIEVIQKLYHEVDPDNTFVSFTVLDKLGVNPSTIYKTPVGIYAYPFWYVHENISKDHESLEQVVPYAGHSRYFHVFNGNGNIINLAEPAACNRAISQILKGEGLDETVFEQVKKSGLNVSIPGFKLWSLTLFLANLKSKHKEEDGVDYEGIRKEVGIAGPTSVAWNAIFRKYGIDGVVDVDGAGIIHPNEPIQAVFFSIASIKNVSKYINRNSTEYKKNETFDTFKTENQFRTIRTMDSFSKMRSSIFHDIMQVLHAIKTEQQYNSAIGYSRPWLPKDKFEHVILTFLNRDEIKISVKHQLHYSEVQEFWRSLMSDLVALMDEVPESNDDMWRLHAVIYSSSNDFRNMFNFSFNNLMYTLF